MRHRPQFLERNPLLGDALDAWVNRPEYLRACVVRAARVDLKGEADGAVTEKEAA